MIKHVNVVMESFGLSRFLFFQVPAEVEVDLEEINLLTNAKIAGLLPCAALKKEDDLYLRFDQISDFNLARLFTQKLNKEHLTTYLVNIVENLVQLQGSNLNLQNILLNKQYIFLDHFSNRLVFMYFPIKNNHFETLSLKEFFRDLIVAAPYDESDDLFFFIKLHNYLTGEAELDLLDFKEKLTETPIEEALVEHKIQMPLEEILEPVSNFYSPGNVTAESSTSVNNGVLTSQYASRKVDKKTSKQLEIEEEVQYKRITRTELGEGDSLLNGASPLGGGTSINIVPNLGNYHGHVADEVTGGTTVLGAQHYADQLEIGTTVLGVANQAKPQPFLVAVQNGEKIVLTKAVFKIGRDPELADYASKNKAVGRVHAEVVSENEEYFFIDIKSRNGSYINGQKVHPNERNKLKHEDSIKLANEEYVFHLY